MGEYCLITVINKFNNGFIMVNDGNNCYNGLYGSTVGLYVLNNCRLYGYDRGSCNLPELGCKTPIEVFSDIGF